MITIKNKIKKIKVNERKIRTDVQKILDFLHYSDYDIGILFTSNKAIHKYNLTFRNVDKPTDVLSFAYHADLKAGKRIQPKSAEDKNLGDLIISLEYVQKDAPNWNHTFEQRLRILLVHGICHLLGHDHIKEKEYKVMQALENKILKQL